MQNQNYSRCYRCYERIDYDNEKALPYSIYLLFGLLPQNPREKFCHGCGPVARKIDIIVTLTFIISMLTILYF
jgi:hypothetical protein